MKIKNSQTTPVDIGNHVRDVRKIQRYKVFTYFLVVIVVILLFIILDLMTPKTNQAIIQPTASSSLIPKPNRINTPTPTVDVIQFPQSGKMKEGTARIEDSYGYDYHANKNFMLILTYVSENVLNHTNSSWEPGTEYRYPITLEGSVDAVTDPKIGYGHKHGCVTIQASGYVGSYVFNIETGEGLDQGPQYSNCVEWLDENRVIIWENLYATPDITYYMFNAKTKDKTVLSRTKTWKP